MADKQAATLPDIGELRAAIQTEYSVVANQPDKGFHFHTGRRLASILEYQPSWLEGIPEPSIESFAGTGNPWRAGLIREGECVVDIGCGAGIDSLIAAKMAGPSGRVIGIDMTRMMLDKAKGAAAQAGVGTVEFIEGYAEKLPVPDGWADVVTSNGVLNLTPDKTIALREMLRVLKPGGRIHIADILVSREVPDDAKRDIELWTG